MFIYNKKERRKIKDDMITDYIKNTKIYLAGAKEEGTIPELVSMANRYTSDFTDEDLKKLSESAKALGFEEKYVKIPLLLTKEREFEKTEGNRCPYEQLKIYYYSYGDISFSRSNYIEPGTELEIRSEAEKLLISLVGIDEDKTWYAANAYPIEEFLNGDDDWLEKAINETIFYGKQYNEED